MIRVEVIAYMFGLPSNSSRYAILSVLAMIRNSRFSSGSGSHLELDHCDRFYHTTLWTFAIGPVFTPKTRHFNLTTLAPNSTWVLIVLWHVQYVDFAGLAVLYSPRSDLRSDQYWLSLHLQPANFASNLALFDSDSTNIVFIANMNAEGERAAKTAQSTYWSCHDIIRTQKLNCSQSTAKVVGTVKWNHSPVPTWPKTQRFMSSLGTNQAIVTQIGFLGGSWPGPGSPGRFQPRPLPGTREPLPTVHIIVVVAAQNRV